jgi:hypothetical protein
VLQVLKKLKSALDAVPIQPQSLPMPLLHLLLPPAAAAGPQGQAGTTYHCILPAAEEEFLQQVVATLGAQSKRAALTGAESLRPAAGTALIGALSPSTGPLSPGPFTRAAPRTPSVLPKSRGGAAGSSLRLQADQLAVLEASCGAHQPRLQLMQGPPGTGGHRGGCAVRGAGQGRLFLQWVGDRWDRGVVVCAAGAARLHARTYRERGVDQ